MGRRRSEMPVFHEPEPTDLWELTCWGCGRQGWAELPRGRVLRGRYRCQKCGGLARVEMLSVSERRSRAKAEEYSLEL